jgi:CorA-like Mg2+ transporter protein
MSTEELLKKLEDQRLAYLDTFRLVQELLGKEHERDPASPSAETLPLLPEATDSFRKYTLSRDPTRKGSGFPLSTLDTSTLSDDSDAEDDAYFVQDLLPSQSYDHEHLRDHLKTYDWDEWGRQILSTLVTERGRLTKPELFPQHQEEAIEDRSHYSHYQIYDCGRDGAPLLTESTGVENAPSKAHQIWHSIKDINADATRSRQAVGRITIAREPSPILFAALHLTLNQHFSVDELFKNLVQSDASSADVHRAFDEDKRKQKSFVFNFEYFTIIGEECKPMTWQLADRQQNSSETHIALTRCSAIVALSLLSEKPIKKVRNPARRAKTKHGYVYDPWSPWHVLNIQCYPDWRATTEVHDSSKHYVNGIEAFLHTLLAEYRDAQTRFWDIYENITKLITPPPDFLFNDKLRDDRLFEDKDFTYSRRYFWAHQCLGTMNDHIKAMIDGFEDTFTEDVWEGKHKTLWPLLDEDSPRNQFFKKRLKRLRLSFEREIDNMKILIKENNERRQEIKSLRDQLFSGTSVLESRKSVELSEITILQGHNIKLLTLVNIFFLPLTFVTSVFGMTNMRKFLSLILRFI